MKAMQVIKQIRLLGINQISEGTIKDWFSKRPYLETTGKEIKKCAKEVGITLKPCNIFIPNSFMPVIVFEDRYKDVNNVFTEKEIVNLYFRKNLTAKEISALKGCGINTFYCYLKKFGFETKKKIEINQSLNINIEVNNG